MRFNTSDIKKICVCALLVFASAAYAVDASVETGSEQNVKKDASLSVDKTKDKKDTKRKSSNSSNQKSVSQEISFDTYPIFLPYTNECVKNPKSLVDFGISTQVRLGRIDVLAQQAYDAIAKNNSPISTAKMDEKGFKKYLACLSVNGAKMSQANIIFSKIAKEQKSFSKSQLQESARSAFMNSENITDKIIVSQLALINKSLNDECSFYNSVHVVKCGGLVFDFTQNQLKLGAGVVYGYNGMFGVSSSFKVSVNDSDTDSFEVANETGSSSSKKLSLTKSQGDSDSASAKDTVNLQSLIPSIH